MNATAATEKPARKYAYYPGCSLGSSASEYDHSTRAVFAALGVELEEIADWNCCGASSAHALNHTLATALPLRNLALAEAMELDIAVPCAACFSRLKTAEHRFREEPDLKNALREIVGEPYEGKVTARHSLDILFNDVGLDAVREKVTRPLTGLRTVCYYGCLLVRPPKVTGATDPDNPVSMDLLMKALGAESLDWHMKTDCCGAGLSLTRADIVSELVAKIAAAARLVQAQAIVTACPMCHANLDMRQPGALTSPSDALPVYFYTELMAAAMGIEGTAAWLAKHIVPAAAPLEEIGALPRRPRARRAGGAA
ncbi:MAG: CoB--CoM heterodisulfide reductase iron-sulfur subunit B family protein [bacterium]